ncbi:hypothetical protein JNUCC1_03077 [Lentibacillus sp. JNUCC-1]|uniref:hypothetical protein n=1 Tax=Lentibacillus sp. JNUCC-1 TaxID=2654513 RepID=UPI0012E7B885|nr:hypothetical protein [Lentibacillus sp. JNUCC-1]MUV39204.1 hypothetical protein [Lentibacillus sp. JNUCC-1]
MNETDQQRLHELGKKHKKFLEDYTINIDGYKVNNHLFFLAMYMSKFSENPKAYAVFSLEHHNREEAKEAFYPLFFYFSTWNIILEVVQHRAQVTFSILEEVRDYLARIVNARLSAVDMTVYERSLNILQNMLDLQEEMKHLWQSADQMDKQITEKGYVDDQEIEQLILYHIKGHWIQYAQFKDRYTYRKDFDVIYDNRNIPEVKKHEKFTRKKTLYNMRSNIAADQLKKSIAHLTEGKAPMDYETFMDHFYDVYKERVQQQFEKVKPMLRYP